MKKVCTFICIIGFSFGISSCADPNEDVLHDINKRANTGETTGDTGGMQVPTPPPSGSN